MAAYAKLTPAGKADTWWRIYEKVVDGMMRGNVDTIYAARLEEIPAHTKPSDAAVTLTNKLAESAWKRLAEILEAEEPKPSSEGGV
jgi:hypothetical protein